MILECEPGVRLTHKAMGTIMTHRAFGLSAKVCLDEVSREIGRIERLLSRFLPESDVSRVNGSAGIQSEKVSPDTFEVLAKSVEFSRKFPETFDVTIEPLVQLWSTGKEASVQPDEVNIMQILPLVNFRDLILDPWEMTAELRFIGQSIDLGGIGKGYAGDQILEVFKAFGIESAFSNLGGNVVTLGSKPDGAPWQIGIQHPRQEDRLIGIVSVVDQSVVTSGDYQRCYTDIQGNRHHHILNPSTGYPSRSGLISVTVVAERSMTADALSTMLFVAGLEKGLEILRCYPAAEAVLVDEDLQVFVTEGLKDYFLADEGINCNIFDRRKEKIKHE